MILGSQTLWLLLHPESSVLACTTAFHELRSLARLRPLNFSASEHQYLIIMAIIDFLLAFSESLAILPVVELF